MQNDSEFIAYVKATQKSLSGGFDIRIPAKFARYMGMQRGEYFKVTIDGDSLVYTLVDGRHAVMVKTPTLPKRKDPDIIPATTSVASRLLKRFAQK